MQVLLPFERILKSPSSGLVISSSVFFASVIFQFLSVGGNFRRGRVLGSMAVELVEGYGWVLISLFVNIILTQWMGFKVGAARKQFKVFYPTMYAVESENKDAKQFNCVQRGHQNTLEFMSTFVALLLLSGLQYPIIAALLGALYSVGRFQYFRGYSTGKAASRYQGGGGSFWLALMGLQVCTIALILHQFFPAYV